VICFKLSYWFFTCNKTTMAKETKGTKAAKSAPPAAPDAAVAAGETKQKVKSEFVLA
jgi:hypothetical protein